MCGKDIEVTVESGFDAKVITVQCGNTSPSGNPWMCKDCTKIHGHRNFRQEAAENNEPWEEDV